MQVEQVIGLRFDEERRSKDGPPVEGGVAELKAVGVIEAMSAGYLSSAYKDAVPFALIFVILFFMPRGLMGAKVTERV